MKILLTSLALVLLTGCSTVVPVKQNWPEPPGKQSTVPCPDLKKLAEPATLSTIAKTVSENYTEYYTCAVKLDAWQEWYQQQKIIHEGLK